jgi:hypothetical protein
MLSETGMTTRKPKLFQPGFSENWIRNYSKLWEIASGYLQRPPASGEIVKVLVMMYIDLKLRGRG